MAATPFDPLFLTPGTVEDFRAAIEHATAVLIERYGRLPRPYSGRSPAAIAEAAARLEVCPEEGRPLADVLDLVGREVLADSLMVSDPRCMAHLHCPPMVPALAAEVLISATNQSMDSWDQAPTATYCEQRVVDWLCGLYGFASGDGIFTSGGTQSNFMGLLFARDAFALRHLGWKIQTRGLPPEAGRFRILSSAISHFSVKQSAALLGLGHDAVVPVAVDEHHRMSIPALAETLERLKAEGLLPIAVVATAGTTDFGSIDPLAEIAALGRAHGLWVHVDAAYGGALALSDAHAGRLAGIGEADSITADFHKLFWQPVSCGAFLVRDPAAFRLIQLNADYLNPESNEAAGILDLVGKSIQTTRRFDGLKLFMSLNVLGRQGLARMIDATIDLAAATAAEIRTRPALELANQPALNAVVLRYVGHGLDDAQADGINTAIRDHLMQTGFAWLAQTKREGRVSLKMTLLNPRTTLEDIRAILDEISRLGALHEGRVVVEA